MRAKSGSLLRQLRLDFVDGVGEDDEVAQIACPVTPTRDSRPLASLATLDRVLADANLVRSRKARANLENLEQRGKRAARSRTASTASDLEQRTQ